MLLDIVEDAILRNRLYSMIQGKTFEVVNHLIEMEISEMSEPLERARLKEWMKERALDFDAKYREEESHYKALEYQLKAKLDEIRYFFKEGPETRKCVAFSTDCISTIHFMVRPGVAVMNVLVRSSDAVKLLPVDLFGICMIMKEMVKHLGIEKIKQRINVLTTSLHIYQEDQGRCHVNKKREELFQKIKAEVEAREKRIILPGGFGSRNFGPELPK